LVKRLTTERRKPMAKEYSEKVIKEFPDIPAFEGKTRSGTWKVRVVQNGGGRKILDVREYLESPSYTGFTRRGIRLDAEQLEVLEALLLEIKALLE
jgi:hypothetical protein